MPDTLPEERGRRMDRLLTAFSERRLLVSSRRGEQPSVPRRSLAPPAMVSHHNDHHEILEMASAVAATEAAVDELLCISEPWLTIVSPTAYMLGWRTLRMQVAHRRLDRFWPIQYEGLRDDCTLDLASIPWSVLGGTGWS